jgi:hypothetical protein
MHLRSAQPRMLVYSRVEAQQTLHVLVSLRKQADALKVCPIPDACLLVMAQRPYRLLGLPETRSLIFLIKNSPDKAEEPGGKAPPPSFIRATQ